MKHGAVFARDFRCFVEHFGHGGEGALEYIRVALELHADHGSVKLDVVGDNPLAGLVGVVEVLESSQDGHAGIALLASDSSQFSDLGGQRDAGGNPDVHVVHLLNGLATSIVENVAELDDIGKLVDGAWHKTKASWQEPGGLHIEDHNVSGNNALWGMGHKTCHLENEYEQCS